MLYLFLLLLLINFKTNSVILDESEVTDDILSKVNLDLNQAAVDPHKEVYPEAQDEILKKTLSVIMDYRGKEKELKDDLYKKAVIEFDINDPIKKEHKFLTFKLQSKDWSYYLNELRKIVEISNIYDADKVLGCLVAPDTAKCDMQNPNIKLTTIFDLDNYIHLKLKELEKLDKSNDLALRGNFKDFMIRAQQFINDFTKRIDSAKTNAPGDATPKSKDLLKHLLNIYKKVIKEAKDKYQSKLDNKKQVYTKAHMISKLDNARRAIESRLKSNINPGSRSFVLNKELVGALNKLNVVLKEVKTYVDDSGTKDLLCFVALTNEEKLLCQDKSDIKVRYEDTSQPVTIFYLNELISYILDLKLFGLSEAVSKDLESKFGIFESQNANNLYKTVNNIIFKLRNAIKAVSTWRQGPKDAQAVLINAVQGLEIIFNLISKLDSQIASTPPTNNQNKNIKSSTEKYAALPNLPENIWDKLKNAGINKDERTEELIFDKFDKNLNSAEPSKIIKNINNAQRIRKFSYDISNFKNEIMQAILEERAKSWGENTRLDRVRYVDRFFKSDILKYAIELQAIKWAKNKLDKDTNFKEELGQKLIFPKTTAAQLEILLKMGADPNYIVKSHLIDVYNDNEIVKPKLPLEEYLTFIPNKYSDHIEKLIQYGAKVKPEYLELLKTGLEKEMKDRKGSSSNRFTNEYKKVIKILENSLNIKK